jgi:AraC-like DNA-binding protein
MVCQAFLPSPALREYVQGYQLRHFVFSGTASLPFKPYAPRPEQTLAFYPRSLERVEYVSSKRIVTRARSTITGQYVERTNRHLGGEDFLVLIVNFHPGVLYRLTGIAFSEFTNADIDAELVFPKEIRLVNQRLNSAESYPEMIALVERFLVGVVTRITRQTHPVDAVANQLMLRPGQASLDKLSQAAFLCPRQFERKFKERMGVSPKLFTRIARLHMAFCRKYHQPDQDWLTIALACGYYDHQHLMKEFGALAGTTPTGYLLQDTYAPERIFGLQDSSLLQ